MPTVVGNVGSLPVRPFGIGRSTASPLFGIGKPMGTRTAPVGEIRQTIPVQRLVDHLVAHAEQTQVLQYVQPVQSTLAAQAETQPAFFLKAQRGSIQFSLQKPPAATKDAKKSPFVLEVQEHPESPRHAHGLTAAQAGQIQAALIPALAKQATATYGIGPNLDPARILLHLAEDILAGRQRLIDDNRKNPTFKDQMKMASSSSHTMMDGSKVSLIDRVGLATHTYVGLEKPGQPTLLLLAKSPQAQQAARLLTIARGVATTEKILHELYPDPDTKQLALFGQQAERRQGLSKAIAELSRQIS